MAGRGRSEGGGGFAAVGVDPATGARSPTSTARFYALCRCADASGQLGQQNHEAQVLAKDQSFTELVGSVAEPVTGSYAQPELGEIRYLALPATNSKT